MRSRSLATIGLLCLPLLGVAARASDGVLEISQACAEAPGTGCFPGDSPGFPVTITQPGSYRLTGNLVVPSGTSGLRVAADGISIDLNGFAVNGPFICVAPCYSGTGSGVESAPALGNRASVSRGEISGFGLDGVNLRNDALVERLLVTNTGRHGIVIGPGSIALANRIRAVGDNGLNMINYTGWLSAPIYRDNVISETNLAGAGALAASGGRATGGNGCADGSCSARGARRFYVTTTLFTGANAWNRCEAGFHMGSLWEMLDPSALEYDRIRGGTGVDSGHGPPYISGWVRTGSNAGDSSCLNWGSALQGEQGTSAELTGTWATQSASQIHPWVVTTSPCNTLRAVWCVED
jgi:hypothetical protein